MPSSSFTPATLVQGLRAHSSRFLGGLARRLDPGALDPLGSREPEVEAPESAAELQRVKELIFREISCILVETESSTLSLGSNLGDIVRRAEAFVRQVQASVGNLDSDDESSVSSTLNHQCQTVEAFLAGLGEAVEGQRTASEEVLRTSQTVGKAAKAVEEISAGARILCLNTMIEAARLGDQGRPLLVIGTQMRELSDSIAKSNQQISTLAKDLEPLLDEVEQKTASIQDRASSFAKEFEVQRARIGEVTDSLQHTTRSALGAGDENVAGILQCSHESLVSLQTQDIISQRLKRIMSLLGQELEGVPGHPPIGVPVVAVHEDCGSTLEGPAAPLPDAEPAQEGDLAAGEIEFF